MLVDDSMFRIEGRLVCGRCAEVLGGRVRVAYWSLVGLLVIVIGFGVYATGEAIVTGDRERMWFGLFELGIGTGLLFLMRSVLRDMRRANETAESLAQLRTAIEVLKPD